MASSAAQPAERKASHRARLDSSCKSHLRGFVSNRRSNFVCQFRSDFAHVVRGASMFGGLLQNLLFGFALSYVVAIRDYVAAVQYFRHGNTSLTSGRKYSRSFQRKRNPRFGKKFRPHSKKKLPRSVSFPIDRRPRIVINSPAIAAF